MTIRDTIRLLRAGGGTGLDDPAADVRDLSVRGRDGEDLGTVEDLVMDDEERRVRFLLLRQSGRLRVGERRSFLPVDTVVDVTEDVVLVGEPGRRVQRAPAYAPQLIDDVLYVDAVYGYYGCTPFWRPGYLYPGFPYRRD